MKKSNSTVDDAIILAQVIAIAILTSRNSSPVKESKIHLDDLDRAVIAAAWDATIARHPTQRRYYFFTPDERDQAFARGLGVALAEPTENLVVIYVPEED